MCPMARGKILAARLCSYLFVGMSLAPLAFSVQWWLIVVAICVYGTTVAETNRLENIGRCR